MVKNFWRKIFFPGEIVKCGFLVKSTVKKCWLNQVFQFKRKMDFNVKVKSHKANILSKINKDLSRKQQNWKEPIKNFDLEFYRIIKEICTIKTYSFHIDDTCLKLVYYQQRFILRKIKDWKDSHSRGLI